MTPRQTADLAELSDAELESASGGATLSLGRGRCGCGKEIVIEVDESDERVVAATP
ncbi:MAG: hypothetical protein IPG50_24680 [Myxococcales bacterium]|nr:hypothetical protein [Myxococcales bacterium]